MKKLSLLLALVMTAVIVCGAVPAVAENATVVTYWTNDRHDAEYMNAMIEAYNNTNTDGIRVELQVITDEYENQVLLAYTGNTAPDIVGQSITLKNFVDNGMLISLSDYIAADATYQLVNEPYEHAYEGLNAIGDDIYWVFSGMRSGVRIEYNVDLLASVGYTEVPKTLDEYIELAAAITKAGNGDYYGIGFTSSSPFERQLEMISQVSGIYYYDYVNGCFDFSGYKPILEKANRLITEEIAYPDQQGVDNMRALFQNGKFALWGNASQEAGVFTEQLPITDFEWAVAEVPTLDGEVKGALQTTPSKAYAIMSSSEHPDAAWKVIQYFQSESFLKGYLEGGYCLPISSHMDGIIDKSKIGRLADFSLLDYESVYPAVPTINLTGDDYRTVLWNAVMGYVGIDEAIEDLNTRYNEAYEMDIADGSVLRLVIADYNPLQPSAGTAQYLNK